MKEATYYDSDMADVFRPASLPNWQLCADCSNISEFLRCFLVTDNFLESILCLYLLYHFISPYSMKVFLWEAHLCLIVLRMCIKKGKSAAMCSLRRSLYKTVRPAVFLQDKLSPYYLYVQAED